MKKALLVFTNYASLDAVIADKKRKKGINLIEKESIIGFDEQEGRFSKDYINKQVLLVNDHTSVEALMKYGDNKADYTYLVIKHTQTSEEVFKTIASKALYKIGMHTETGPHYDVVFNILLDDEERKFERIIAKIFPHVEESIDIEKKLILLHACLHPESAAKTDSSFLSSYENSIVTYLANHKDNLAIDYFSKVEELRKLLLGY